jgi:hypothetical protein
METGISSSLIPHEAIMDTDRRRGGGLSDAVLVLSIILLVVSIGLAGSVYLYQQYVNHQLDSKKSSIDAANKSLDPSTISYLITTNNRLKSVQQLMDKHLAPSLLFDALGTTTLQTIAFDNLTYSASDEKKIHISMSGTAYRVNSVALQEQLFSKNDVIIDPVFSGVSRQANGVKFNVSANIDPRQITYAHLVNVVGAVTQTQPHTQTQTPAATPSPFGTPNSSQ